MCRWLSTDRWTSLRLAVRQGKHSNNFWAVDSHRQEQSSRVVETPAWLGRNLVYCELFGLSSAPLFFVPNTSAESSWLTGLYIASRGWNNWSSTTDFDLIMHFLLLHGTVAGHGKNLKPRDVVKHCTFASVCIGGVLLYWYQYVDTPLRKHLSYKCQPRPDGCSLTKQMLRQTEPRHSNYHATN